ncbi:MAG: hypothetical protein K2W85_04575 [Phycisphaerales bacterium]|nr:hypothetical protein [Phycisphaerales bacterium]
MKPFVPKPHVSGAVRQLRGWVTLASAVLAVCCLTQMLVYGFAAYTEVRVAELKPVKSERAPLRVVGAMPVVEPAEPRSAAAGLPTEPKSEPVAMPLASQPTGLNTDAHLASATAVNLNRVSSPADQMMKRASGIAGGVGIISCVTLAVLALLGVVVAGGASIPGVERVTTAGVWSLVLALMALPWHAMLPSMGVPGIFADYAALTVHLDGGAGVSAVTLSGLGMAAQWVLMPIMAMFVCLGVCLWFRAGVERGVIITAPSELDKAVEREVEQISKRGVASSAPKAVGALHRAIGEEVRGPEQAISAVERAIENAASLVGVRSGEEDDTPITRRRIPRGIADEDYKRPI